MDRRPAGTVFIRRVDAAEPRGTATHNRELRSPAVEAAVAEVCAEATSAELFRGAEVVVKPNLFMPHAPATTDPRVTGGVVSWLLRSGAKSVTVAEESSISTHVGRGSSTREAAAHVGYDELVASFDSPRVRWVELRSEGTTPTEVRQGLALRQVDYPALLAQADRIVNVPILKFHLQTLLTGAVKNTWSAAAPLQRMMNHCWGLGSALLDVHYLRPPDLTLVDALQPLARDHSYGDPLDARLVLASTDSIALDAVGAYILGSDDPAAVETVRLGTSAGLGEGRLERVTLEGVDLADLPRSAPPDVAHLPAEFPPLAIEWHCGRRVGPGCVSYLTAGLRSVAANLTQDNRTWQIFVGEGPEAPDQLADRVLFVGACALQGDTFRRVQRQLYLEQRTDALTIVPGCPPMALRTEMLKMVGLD